ncbi:MAG: XdhC family protein [Armatimonadota bacterium]|nr:XdhC family protein [Armatimonadota bacterium]
MKELRDILTTYESLQQQGRPAALATVVAVSGSSYRRPGARMLMTEDGPIAGGVSGGCLESDVFQRARLVMEHGRADIVTYDTTEDGDIVFGVGLGCRGVIQILIEPLTGPRPDFEFLTGLLQCREAGVCATVFRSEGHSPLCLGDRLLLSETGSVHHEIADAELAERIQSDALDALVSGKSCTRDYALYGGSASVFLEAIKPPLSLVIFGAGHDAPPLVRLAKEIGWHVIVADPRPAYATVERFPQADVVLAFPLEEAASRLSLDARTAAVLMTHNYLNDRTLLEQILPSPVRYLGVLGPKRRTERLLSELPPALLTNEALSRLHSPVGLDIGADTPELIALSIITEIQATTAARSGRPLRDRPGPIYPPEPSLSTAGDILPACGLAAS